MSENKETRIADNIRKVLEKSKTISEVQKNLKLSLITDNWIIEDLYSIDDYINRIFGRTDDNRYLKIYSKYEDINRKAINYDFVAELIPFKIWKVPILLNYIGELIFQNKDILLRWDSSIKK